MKYFPKMEDYNLVTPGGMALYSAHCDLEPILGMIEELDRSMITTIKQYGDMGIKAQRSGDLYESCELLDIQHIFSNKIRPLVYESMLIILVSRMEEAFACWCRILCIKDSSLPAFETFHDKKGALENAIAYLKKYGNINGIKQDRNWAFVKTIREARNMVVHNGSRVKESLWSQMEDFHIEMRPEDHSLFLDNKTILRMYDAIIEFVDRVFMLPLDLSDE